MFYFNVTKAHSSASIYWLAYNSSGAKSLTSGEVVPVVWLKGRFEDAFLSFKVRVRLLRSPEQTPFSFLNLNHEKQTANMASRLKKINNIHTHIYIYISTDSPFQPVPVFSAMRWFNIRRAHNFIDTLWEPTQNPYEVYSMDAYHDIGRCCILTCLVAHSSTGNNCCFFLQLQHT